MVAAADNNAEEPKGKKFDNMGIDELRQHESGILNLFEGERNIAKYVSHN